MSYTAVAGAGYIRLEVGAHGTYTAPTPEALLAWVKWNSFSGSLVYGPGVHLFTGSETLPNANLSVVIEPGAALLPAHTGAIGLFELTGDNVAITGGGQILIPTWVNNQVVMKITGATRPRVRDLLFKWSATGGSSANPMTGLLLHDCHSESVTGNLAFPVAGSVPFRSNLCDAGVWSGNTVRPEAKRTPTSGGTYVDVYVPFWMHGMQLSTFEANECYGLGGASSKLEYALLMQWDADLAGEQGHNRITGNRFEACYAKRWIALYGGNFSRIDHNLLGQNEAAAGTMDYATFTAGSQVINAAIHVDSSNHLGSGQQAVHTQIHDNDIHNWGGDSPVIAAGRCTRLYIRNNTFGLINAITGAIAIDGDTCSGSIYVDGNTFDGGGTQDRAVYVIQLAATSPAALTEMPLLIKDNTADGFVQAFEPVGGIHGPYDPFGMGFEDALTIAVDTISFQSIATSAGDFPRLLDSGSGFGSIVVGDYVQLLGATNKSNRGVWKVRTQAAGQLDMELEQLSAVTLNDFTTEAAGADVILKVFKRGFNSNVTN